MKRVRPQTAEVALVLQFAPEGLYGRRKMIALLRRKRLLEAPAGAVNRAMCDLRLS